MEHGPYRVREPAVQLFAAVACVQPLDAEPKFSQCYRTDVKLIQRTGSNKGQNFGSGLILRARFAEAAVSQHGRELGIYYQASVSVRRVEHDVGHHARENHGKSR